MKMIRLKIQMNTTIAIVTFLPITHIRAVPELLRILCAQRVCLCVVRAYDTKAKNIVIGALN